jgi:DnaK suppressor protein
MRSQDVAKGPVVEAKNLLRYKELLLAKRDELAAVRDRATPVPAARESEGDLMDFAGADAEAELHVWLHQTDDRLLTAIEAALARIRTGVFGECAACKQPISKTRLEAVPWTRLCRDCKEREHA